MSQLISQWFGNWRHLLEKPLSVEDLERAVETGSIPAFPFFFMLASSAAIATFGLLGNSAGVIIGAMIVAPLMNPIISLSFGLVAGRGALSMRSVLTIITGTLFTVALAFAFTEAIGWKIAGSEIIARMSPSLLDLGVAVAAGAAAAFAYTRPRVSSALAGIAIAVALVPPLCTVGIAVALGQEGSAEVGLAFDGLGARGPFLLFLTNIVGIVFAASLVFFWQYFRRRLLAILTLLLTLFGLFVVVPPLGVSMDNLLIRNQIHRSITVESQAVFPIDQNVRFTNISVRILEGEIFVRTDVVSQPGAVTQATIDVLRHELSKIVKLPVNLEVGIIPETVLQSHEGANSDG